MNENPPEAAAAGVFHGARTVQEWQDREVETEVLQRLYEVLRAGPTSANGFPLRLVFVSSDSEKARVVETAMPSNRPCLENAPVVAIVAYDSRFFLDLPQRFPAAGESMKKLFESNDELAQVNAFRNGTLQGGYFLYAARAVGLDYAPMSGFDNAAVDAAFFPEGRIKSNFLCGLGYGRPEGLPAQPERPGWDEICRIV
ncbi:MAG: malonic semialdehyde reductase [Acidobacteriota bacterium]